jgi:hypothetical protein
LGKAILIDLERLPRPVLAFGVPLLFFAIALGVMPIADTLQFDPDEGIELAKATLYGQGYQLYDPIWNDQPPLLTLLLAAWLKVFGSQIVAARLLILGFATVLVGSFFNILVRILGLGAALLGTLGLCLTLDFLRLSVSVMQGIPALALVMLAIYLLMGRSQPQLKNPLEKSRSPLHSPPQPPNSRPQGHKKGGRNPEFRGDLPPELGCRGGQCNVFNAFQESSKTRNRAIALWKTLSLIASGICFGLSLEIKLYTALMLPACLLHIVLGASLQDWRQFKPHRLGLGLVWLLSCGLTILGVAYFTHSLSLNQILGSHFDGSAQVSLQREPSWQLLLMFLAQDLDYTLLAGVGIYLLFKQRKPWPVLPLVWLVSVLFGLTYYKPLWYHYYPLVSVPVVWLAAYGLTPSFQFFRQKRWYKTIRWRKLKQTTVPGVAAGFVIFAIALTPVKLAVNAYINYQFVAESKPKLEAIEKVRALRSSTHWLYTDLPIVAFYTDLNVPPELAVFSTKRIASGSLSDTKLMDILQTYQPEQVLLGRYPKVKTALAVYLNKHYVKQYEKDEIVQYILIKKFEK